MSLVGAADAAGLAGIGMFDIAPWSMPFMPSMMWEAGVDGAVMGFFLAFLAGAFVAGFAVLFAAAGIVMPGMELMSIADVLLDAGALCAVAASGNASSSAASNAERC
jgi:hypothetical protein